jgi:hypothetical protein
MSCSRQHDDVGVTPRAGPAKRQPGKKPPVAEITNAGYEPKTKEVAQREDMLGGPGSVGIMLLDPEVAFMVEKPVNHMRGFACRGVDDFGMERRELIGDMSIKLHTRIVAIPRIDVALCPPLSSGAIILAVRG